MRHSRRDLLVLLLLLLPWGIRGVHRHLLHRDMVLLDRVRWLRRNHRNGVRLRRRRVLLLWLMRRRERRGKIQRRRGLKGHLRLRRWRRSGALHRLHGRGELHEGRLLIRLVRLLLARRLRRETGGRAEGRHGRRVLLVHRHGGRCGSRRRQVRLVKCGGGGEVRRIRCGASEDARCEGGRGPRRRRVGMLLLLRGLLVMMGVVVVRVNHVPGVLVERRLLRLLHSVGAGHSHCRRRHGVVDGRHLYGGRHHGRRDGRSH